MACLGARAGKRLRHTAALKVSAADRYSVDLFPHRIRHTRLVTP